MAPFLVYGYNTSSRSIQVHWNFDNKVRNVLGVLKGFRVFYKLHEDSAAVIQHFDQSDQVNTTTLSGLNIYTLYNISVAAFTRIGHGPVSNSTVVRTAGEGMEHNICSRIVQE